MASNPHRPFEILSRLRHPSGRFRHEFKEMLFALSYTAALLGLFMNKVAVSHVGPGVTGSVLQVILAFRKNRDGRQFALARKAVRHRPAPLLPIGSRRPRLSGLRTAESWLSPRWSGPNGWRGQFRRTAQST